MNWSFLRVEALLPLVQALGLTLLTSATFAFRLHRQGGSSRVALGRFLRFALLVFLCAFLLAGLWDARATLRGLTRTWQGHPRDQYALGLLRKSGRGFLTRDPAKAADWFRRAAEQGEADAQLALAQAYLHGEGAVKDPAEALRWAQASADQGNTDAMLLAGDLLKTQDSARAEALYHQALARLKVRSSQGDAQAMLTLGSMYFRGQGMAPDPVEGYAWMLAADRRGIAGLQRVIVLLEAGQLTPAQRAQATERAKALRPSQAKD